MVEFAFFVLILILLFITYGLFKRKKLYGQIDKLEEWKIDIMNRPVTEEIAKVKQLNMTGQTEEKFENWRATWDDIITVSLPKIEELLFDAEEAANRFRFKKSRLYIKEMTSDLEKAESEIQSVLDDLNELIGSEEKNRVEIEELKFELKKVKKQLLTERHEYKKAEEKLESEIKQVENLFAKFAAETEAGNYFQAREVVLTIRDNIEKISEKIEAIPLLMHEFQVEIPTKISELKQGYDEMIADGFILEDLKIIEELAKIEAEVTAYLSMLENGEIAEVSAGMADLKERIEQIYDILEQEVEAKQQIAVAAPKISEALELVQANYKQAAEEADYVQLSYRLKDEDISQLKEIEKQINVAIRKTNELHGKINENNSPYSSLYKDLKQIKEMIANIKETHEQFSEMLQTLRKDELHAREEIVEIRKKLLQARRNIQKSNLPGLPDSYMDKYEAASEGVQELAVRLEEKPLNMTLINGILEETNVNVSKLLDETNDMIEKAALAEKLIQYGNRYRSSNPMFAEKLDRAEQQFRMFDYDNALDTVATAIEEIDPDAIKKINELLAEMEE